MNHDKMYIVIVDTRGMAVSQIDGYEDHTCTEEYFEQHVINNPHVICTKSKVAKLCGLDMKIYFHSHSKELIETLADQRHRRLHEQEHELQLEEQRDDSPHITWSDEDDGILSPAHKGIVEEELELEPAHKVNRGASLLTFDPRTGSCQYKIFGKAYVVVDSGDYPLSNHQVFGITELVSSVRDVYHCDPDHSQRGIVRLLRQCEEYRTRNYGPLSIYEPRYVEPNDDERDYYDDNNDNKNKNKNRNVVEETNPWKEDSENLSTKTVVPEDHYRYRHRHHYYPSTSRRVTMNKKGNDPINNNVHPQEALFREDDVFHMFEPLEQPFCPPTNSKSRRPLQKTQQQQRQDNNHHRNHLHKQQHHSSTSKRFPRIFGACNALA